jgi:hypothetical protein
MMAEKKSKAGKAPKRGRRSEAGGPPSATPNEAAQGRKGGATKASPDALPKTGKHEVGRGDAEGGGLH